MGKLSYNDKLCINSIADFLNSAQLSPFVRVTENNGFLTKSLLTKCLHEQYVAVRVISLVDLTKL